MSIRDFFLGQQTIVQKLGTAAVCIVRKREVLNAIEVCDAGKAVVNGKVARASYDVKVGDVVELNFESRSVKFRVDKVVETIRKEDVSSMYTPL